jgi:hypothetical protein
VELVIKMLPSGLLLLKNFELNELGLRREFCEGVRLVAWYPFPGTQKYSLTMDCAFSWSSEDLGGAAVSFCIFVQYLTSLSVRCIIIIIR